MPNNIAIFFFLFPLSFDFEHIERCNDKLIIIYIFDNYSSFDLSRNNVTITISIIFLPTCSVFEQKNFHSFSIVHSRSKINYIYMYPAVLKVLFIFSFSTIRVKKKINK